MSVTLVLLFFFRSQTLFSCKNTPYKLTKIKTVFIEPKKLYHIGIVIVFNIVDNNADCYALNQVLVVVYIVLSTMRSVI